MSGCGCHHVASHVLFFCRDCSLIDDMKRKWRKNMLCISWNKGTIIRVKALLKFDQKERRQVICIQSDRDRFLKLRPNFKTKSTCYVEFIEPSLSSKKLEWQSFRLGEYQSKTSTSKAYQIKSFIMLIPFEVVWRSPAHLFLEQGLLNFKCTFNTSNLFWSDLKNTKQYYNLTSHRGWEVAWWGSLGWPPPGLRH